MKHPVPVTPLRAPALLQVTVAWVRVSRRGVCVPGHRSGSGGAGAIELLGRWEPGDAISGGGRTRLSICGYLQDRPGTTDEGTGRPGTPDEGTGRPGRHQRAPGGLKSCRRGTATSRPGHHCRLIIAQPGRRLCPTAPPRLAGGRRGGREGHSAYTA